MELIIGCCGWGYFNASEVFGKDWKKKFRSKLQAYAKMFDSVEVNSTFYRLPKPETAEKWKTEAEEVNKSFVFTMKVNQEITHKLRFGDRSVEVFGRVREVGKRLGAKVLLFQTPASFKSTDENIDKMKKFFDEVERDGFVFAWEPRGEWHKNKELIKEVCSELNLVECVDPLRNTPVWFGRERIAYFRLHGFGKPSMYSYKFSDEELRKIKGIVESLNVNKVYLFFNNVFMYDDAIRFKKIIEK
ncbi:MAG: DUF72 domain-containing protein [Candidatus Aenigmarchaeota archaeon]|nr:DUF72 domain-containing protein [Candidatus Aenigmarchaeota archaeon]